jgi:hypothetical protein
MWAHLRDHIEIELNNDKKGLGEGVWRMVFLFYEVGSVTNGCDNALKELVVDRLILDKYA